MKPEPEHATFMLQVGLRDFKTLQGMLSGPKTFEDAIFGSRIWLITPSSL